MSLGCAVRRLVAGWKRNVDENLKKQFLNTCKFSNHDISKFILLLGKMDDWEKFNETSLPGKKDF